jgi:phosphohistidine swiveling domain-containing protein
LGSTWSLDYSHNPEPLSPAQAGLVEMVSSRAGVRMRVVEGYLYSSLASERTPRPESSHQLWRRFLAAEEEIDAILRPLETSDVSSLCEALSAFRAVYDHYMGELAPHLSVAKNAVFELIADLPSARHDAVTNWLAEQPAESFAHHIARAAHGKMARSDLEHYAAPLSPCWDVAAPTYGESPTLIDVALQRENSQHEMQHGDLEHFLAPFSSKLRGPLGDLMRLASAARDISERDDRLFFRAQTVVRRALLSTSREWPLKARDDVFYLQLDLVQRISSNPALAETTPLQEYADHGRAQWCSRREFRMPLEIRDGSPLYAPRSSAMDTFRGVGSGGQRHGKVLRLGSGVAEARGRVVLARALTPPVALSLNGALALVSARGGLLGHGAAMARELGIPFVVACPSAWANLHDGDEVWLDGQAGLVVRTRRSSSDRT